MDTDHRLYAGKVIAELVAAYLESPPGQFGLFLENLPTFSENEFVVSLAGTQTGGRRLRVSVLGGQSRTAALGSPDIQVNFEPEQANTWRNDEDGSGRVPQVVVLVGPAAKVNSLRTTYLNLGSTNLRQHLLGKLYELHQSPERGTFVKALERRAAEFPTPQVLAFAANVHDLFARAGAAGVLQDEGAFVHLLGLMPQRALLTSVGLEQLSQVLRKNRELRERLRNLKPVDRTKLVAAAASSEPGSASLAQTALRFARDGSAAELAVLDYDRLLALLGSEVEPPPNPDLRDPPTRVRKALADEMAVLALASEQGERVGSLLEEVRQSRNTDSEDEAGNVEAEFGGRTFRARPRTDRSAVAGAVRKMFTERSWGGHLSVEAGTDVVDALQRLADGRLEGELFDPAGSEGPGELMRRAVARGFGDSGLLQSWDSWESQRRLLLPVIDDLVDNPLLLFAADDRIRNVVVGLLESYRSLLSGSTRLVETLRARGSTEAGKRLAARLLAIDLVFVRAGDEVQALCGPTHPFHLWHWQALAAMIASDPLRLGEEDLQNILESVHAPPPTAPHVVLSPFALPFVDRARAMIASGRLASLSLFSEPGVRLRGSDGTRALADIAKRFLRLQPHAATSLRVALVDPPSIAEAVKALVSVEGPEGRRVPVPTHIRVLRTKVGPATGEEEQDALDDSQFELSEIGGTLNVDQTPQSFGEIAEALASRPAHLSAVFDPGVARDVTVSVVEPPALHPLVLPRVYSYDDFDDRIDVVPAGESGPFGGYHNLFCDLLERPRTDFVGRRSGATGLAEQLGGLARSSAWMTVLDRGLEPSLQIPGGLRLESRTEAGRDIAVFTARPQSIEDLVADALLAAGLIPAPEALTTVLQELSMFDGESILGLLRPRNTHSLTEPNRAKGLLGTLRVARWYQWAHPDALLVSLDSRSTRKWVTGGDESRRADLLGIRSEGGALVTDVVEVKSGDSADAAATVSGELVEGEGIRQIEVTIATLQRVLAANGDGSLDAARREVLRDQLFRSVASRDLIPEHRKRFVGMLDELFAIGPSAFEGVLAIVRFDSAGNDANHGAGNPLRAPGGTRVRVVSLVESGRHPRPAATSEGELPGPDGMSATRVELDGDRTVPGGGQRTDRESPLVNESQVVGQSGDGPSDDVFLGHDTAGRVVTWSPHRPAAPLNNFGVSVTGVAGSGKTQFVRALIKEVASNDTPVLIFDFKNDYSDADFAGAESLQVYDINRRGLPFNPFSLLPDTSGIIRPAHVTSELSDILGRVFRLGDQQQASLRNAMRQAMSKMGVPLEFRGFVTEGPVAVPSFNTVHAILQDDRRNDALLNRLDPLFSLGLFPVEDAPDVTLEDLLRHKVVLDLHSLPNDNIKSAVTEFLIVRMHGILLRGRQPRRLSRLVVLDEAHRVARSQKLEVLVREGRAFGVGTIVATQFLRDIPSTILGNLETKVIFQPDSEDASVTARVITGRTSGPGAQHVIDLARNLQKHQAIVKNRHYPAGVVVNTLPYYARG